MAVEREGLRRWLAAQGRDAELKQVREREARVRELYAQIGLGKQLAPIVARRLAPDGAEDAKAPAGTPHASAPLAILGTEGMVVSYARCCYPLPGDAVMGYLTAGRGIVIHRDR